jgi:hypothetical protein
LLLALCFSFRLNDWLWLDHWLGFNDRLNDWLGHRLGFNDRLNDWLGHRLNDWRSAAQGFQFIQSSAGVYLARYVTQTLFLSHNRCCIAIRL